MRKLVKMIDDSIKKKKEIGIKFQVCSTITGFRYCTLSLYACDMGIIHSFINSFQTTIVTHIHQFCLFVQVFVLTVIAVDISQKDPEEEPALFDKVSIRSLR